MKVLISDIPSRLSVKATKQEGVMSYDADNAYPQRMMRLVGRSGTAINCINLHSKFIFGKGFKDQNLSRFKINSKGETANQLLKNICDDFVNFNGFSAHINYNLNLNISEISAIPFEHTRLPSDDNEQNLSRISVYEDWAKEFKTRIRREDIKWLDRYSADKNKVSNQIAMVGDIRNWNGQIFWWSNMGERSYPIPNYDSIIEDIDTDSEIKVARNSNVRTGFSASHIFIHKGKFESDEKRQEFINKLAEFQGSAISNSMMVVEVESEEQIPQLIPVESQLTSRVIDITNRTTKDSIIEAFNQPPILHGAQVSGSAGITFSNDALVLAYEYYNSVIEPERKFIGETLKELMRNFEGNVFSDFTIQPLEWATGEGGKQRLIEVIGIGGVQALQGILIDVNLTPQQKISTLVIVFGIKIEEAQQMVL